MAVMKFGGRLMRNLFSKPATKMYPAVPREYPERSRGHIEFDPSNCITCNICGKKCPTDAIKVDKATRTLTIDRMLCIQCGYCAESCPKKCLTIVPGYTEPGAEKVTDIIAAMRGRRKGEDIQSPSRFPGIESPEDLRDLVDTLRRRSGGLPRGVKIAAGHIEEDLEFISHSGCDFITIDGRGGATGSSPKFLKDSSSVPTVYALSRARRYMDEYGMDQELVITGGFRTSGDCIKALAMGADAVAISSAALMALGCQRYRICNTGMCPMGIATQDPELESRLDVDVGSKRVGNYLNALANEIRSFLRVTGHRSLDELSPDDLCTVSDEIAGHTGIRHA